MVRVRVWNTWQFWFVGFLFASLWLVSPFVSSSSAAKYNPCTAPTCLYEEPSSSPSLVAPGMFGNLNGESFGACGSDTSEGTTPEQRRNASLSYLCLISYRSAANSYRWNFWQSQLGERQYAEIQQIQKELAQIKTNTSGTSSFTNMVRELTIENRELLKEIRTNTKTSADYDKLHLEAVEETNELLKGELTTKGTVELGEVLVDNSGVETGLTSVQGEVATNTETANQNLWAVFGLLVGFGGVFVLWRLFRPES